MGGTNQSFPDMVRDAECMMDQVRRDFGRLVVDWERHEGFREERLVEFVAIANRTSFTQPREDGGEHGDTNVHYIEEVQEFVQLWPHIQDREFNGRVYQTIWVDEAIVQLLRLSDDDALDDWREIYDVDNFNSSAGHSDDDGEESVAVESYVFAVRQIDPLSLSPQIPPPLPEVMNESDTYGRVRRSYYDMWSTQFLYKQIVNSIEDANVRTMEGHVSNVSWLAVGLADNLKQLHACCEDLSHISGVMWLELRLEHKLRDAEHTLEQLHHEYGRLVVAWERHERVREERLEEFVANLANLSAEEAAALQGALLTWQRQRTSGFVSRYRHSVELDRHITLSIRMYHDLSHWFEIFEIEDLAGTDSDSDVDADDSDTDELDWDSDDSSSGTHRPASDVPPAWPLRFQPSTVAMFREVWARRNMSALLLDIIICPLTEDVMRDPVTAADGNTYDREAILRWFELHDTSPVTRARLSSTRLVRNRAVRKLILETVEGFSRNSVRRNVIQ